MTQKNEETLFPEPDSIDVSDWQSYARLLREKLEDRIEREDKYQDALKRIVTTHQIDSEEVEHLKRDVEYRENDVAVLYDEIAAVQHVVSELHAVVEYQGGRITSSAQKLENAHLKMAYFEQVICRLNSVISRLEKEIQLKDAHFGAIMLTKGWLHGKKYSREEFNAPVDLSSLPEILPEVSEPAYCEIDVDPVAPVEKKYERSYISRTDIAMDFHAKLESPRSFASPAIGQIVKLSGWCFDKNGKVPEQMWIEVGEQKLPVATGALRQDVVDSFTGKLDVDPNCGFRAEVSTGPGENFIEVHATFEGGASALVFKRIVVNLGFEKTPKRQLDEDYQTWIRNFDSLSLSDIEAQKQRAGAFNDKPLISILLPVYNTEERWLREVVDSVIAQTYENWELCIADDHSPDAHVKTILDEYLAVDSRIKVVYREANGHISAATNSALEVATGEFCALLDHDDKLPVHALYHIVDSLNTNPEADLIFSDEDKIDADGKRFDPYFKSDWNPDLFLSHNCISHLGVYRTSILKEIDGFKEDLYGSQDWDMALRFILKIEPERIRHIPKVLYHWRYLESSTSMSIDSKPYAVTAGKRAIESYLSARGQNADVVEGMWPGAYRVQYRLPELTKASIIIPTRNQKAVTARCVESIFEKTDGIDFEILLVDNQSDDPETLSWFDEISKNEKVRVLEYDHPFNYSAINNFAAREASGDVLVLLNNDVEVLDAGWLQELCSQAMRDEVGVAGGWLLYPDHTVQHSGILMGVCGIAVEAFKHQLEWNIGHMGRAHLNQYYSAVTGACMATRKDVFEKLGGLNEDELAVAYNDVDFCLRAKRDLGLATVWTPYTKLIHHESVSRGYEVSDAQKERIERESGYMMANWPEVIARDPYYNPNLTKFDPTFDLAWPPRQS